MEVEVEVEGFKRWRWRQYGKVKWEGKRWRQGKVEEARWSWSVHGRFETTILLKT